MIAGRTAQTVAFLYEQKGLGGSNLRGKMKVWFEPDSGVWVKQQIIDATGAAGGMGWGTNFEVIKITKPGQ